MTTYTAYFRTDAEFATSDSRPTPPSRRLPSRASLRDDPSELDLEAYDGGMPVNEIAIQDADHNERCGVARR